MLMPAMSCMGASPACDMQGLSSNHRAWGSRAQSLRACLGCSAARTILKIHAKVLVCTLQRPANTWLPSAGKAGHADQMSGVQLLPPWSSRSIHHVPVT